MTKLEYIIGSLAAISIIGLFVLAAREIDYTPFLSITALLIGWLVGKKNGQILGIFKSKK